MALTLSLICLVLLMDAVRSGNVDYSVVSVPSTSIESPVEYGVDVSFPIHSLSINEDVSKDVLSPLGDRQAFYDSFMQSCFDIFDQEACQRSEERRIAMNREQPPKMSNYTDTGYRKLRVPDALWERIQAFWEANRHQSQEEVWDTANTYTNNWQSPPHMITVQNSSLVGGGPDLADAIWEAARVILSEWTGQAELTPTSLYGIRIYHENAILSTHVDRLPLVSSVIINVAQDVDEPWPLEVIGHNGKAKNVTMVPGDMVLYESHSILHGRPFALQGRYMANIFIHFEPLGYSENHGEKEAATSTTKFTTGSTAAHLAAHQGDLLTLLKEIVTEADLVHVQDENGWTPLHEGAAEGHLDVVKLLLDNGADKNAKTSELGGTPLWWAKQSLESNHPVIEFLQNLGAMDVGPEL